MAEHVNTQPPVIPEFGSILDANVPHGVQKAIHQIIMDEYRLTNADVRRRYEAEEARDVEPQIRRANIESRLADLQKDFPEVVKVSIGKNKSGNSYRSIECGSMTLTQSYVESGSRVPREALSRNSLASNMNQMRLYFDDEAERLAAIQALKRVYAIITHTPSINNAAEPSHISIVFVDADCKFIASIDLAERIALNAARSVKVELVTDRAHSRLRHDVAVAAGNEKRA